MSNAARARPVSTGLYMFFFIARLFLLPQPQSGLSADDCNPASASSVNGLLRNEMSFRCAQPRPCAPTPGSRAQPNDCCRLTIRDGIRDHVARLPAAQIGRSELGYLGRWQASQQARHGHWMVACSVYLYIVTFGVNLHICRRQGRALLVCRPLARPRDRRSLSIFDQPRSSRRFAMKQPTATRSERQDPKNHQVIDCAESPVAVT